MHIPFKSASEIVTNECTIWDYVISDDIGLSYQKLAMRGPEAGRYLNKKCHEIYFIISGSARFTVGDEVYDVNQKDVVVVEPGTPHFIETDGLEYITITRPDWYEEQYETIA